MNAVKALIEGIKENSSQKKALGMGDKVLDYFIAEASFDSKRSWVEAVPVTPIKEALAGFGTVISGHREALISCTSALRMVNGEIWVGSSGKPLARFDSNFSFLGYWIGKWDDPNSAPDSYKYVRSFAVDEANDRSISLWNGGIAYEHLPCPQVSSYGNLVMA